MNRGLVSVVIASYNMATYLGEAVDSVLSQDYSPLQVIIVDDGSTDDTQQVLQRFASRGELLIIRQPNQGQTAAKNRGVAAAVGQYVGFCDADNVWVPGKLSRQVELFGENERVGVVYGDVSLIDAGGKSVPMTRVARHSGRITRQLLLDNFVTFNTALVRRAVLSEFGGFDPSLSMGIDYDLWLRISTRYEFRYVPETFVRYRVWEGQMSRNVERRFESAFAILRRFFAAYPDAVQESDRQAAWAHSLVSRARWRFREGSRQAAWRDLRDGLRYQPSNVRGWKTVASFLLSAAIGARNGGRP